MKKRILFAIKNDAIYYAQKRNNELTLAVNEFVGGWIFICRLADFENTVVK